MILLNFKLIFRRPIIKVELIVEAFDYVHANSQLCEVMEFFRCKIINSFKLLLMLLFQLFKNLVISDTIQFSFELITQAQLSTLIAPK